MSEVIKTPSTKTSANKQTAVNSEQTETEITWDSLANDLHERETSWDDLSRLEYKEEGGFKEPKETEEKIEPVFLIKTHTMNQIADIYNTLGGLAVSTGLFAKSPKEIDQIM